ncbi:VanZ family protein [Levilactobacillus namurensis]|uniref:VanZ family protein n=1 Tax=Levilactobacillus namurensis TaxID=380393 RepID=UPI00222F3726|nr:VanZ family protein [Levilactobacillus namurensis]MCW3777298.1 VanZ family protein [Levilactobacillus namurensis]MDT7018636.1 VanZ family protein [Levilactobacillus namurensis]WNN64385.1 VanZ family protein [Levilactobacillus namurensis]
MRWEPLVLIALTASLVGLMILLTMTNRRHRWIALGTLAYLTGLGAIVFTPLSFSGTAVYVMPAGIGRVNLTQLDVWNLGFFENILMTLPLGFLFKRFWPSLSLWGVGFLGLSAGSFIEIAQYILSHHWLINRSSDLNDVLANALGVLMGGLVALALQHLQTTHQQKLTRVSMS